MLSKLVIFCLGLKAEQFISYNSRIKLITLQGTRPVLEDLKRMSKNLPAQQHLLVSRVHWYSTHFSMPGGQGSFM